MLITLSNWIYIYIISYILGFFILPRIAKLIDEGSHLSFNWCDRVVAGLIISTVYAQLFSLFAGVGLAANIILMLICAVFVFIDRKSIIEVFAVPKASQLKNVRSVLLVIAGLITFVLVLNYTALSTFHYDTGLYHAQAIHWIEDYGIIKGLGRLHVRLAYNSAYFPLCALFSMRDITGGQSLHSMSGFLFAILLMYSFYGWIRSPEKGVLCHLLRIAPVFYFLVCVLEITSPESDYITVCLVIWLFIRLAEVYRAENDGNKLAGYCLAAVCAFSLVGFKLSAAVITMITLWPLVIMIRKKNFKGIAVSAALCILVVIPYLIRNVIICGWLVYPVDAIDLFDVPWKFTKDTLTRDANEIGQWAKSMNMKGSTGALAWIPFWWEEQYLATRMFISSMILSLPLMVLSFFFKKDGFMKFLMGVLSVSLVFYLIKAPLIRYCYGPVLILPLMAMGVVTDRAILYLKEADNGSRKTLGVIFTGAAVLACLVILYPSLYSTKELIKFDYEESVGRFEHPADPVHQIDYPDADVKEVDWYGYTVYLPNEGDQCWYYSFPSSPYHECFDYNHPVDNDLRNGVVENDKADS
ncbi:MAG: hypothetical protein IJI51_01620 [Lachnospiraceae bacterium]|nr:hypothetical protein [Lachnospiraceae bacterium]